MIALIVVYQSQQTLRQCVDAAITSGVERVVIWDNSPRPVAEPALRSRRSSHVTIFHDGKNLGFGAAMNRAFDQVEPRPDEEVLLLNPDCIASYDALQRMSSTLSSPGIGIVGPRMHYADGRAGISGGTKPTLIKEALAQTRVDDLLPDRARQWAVNTITRRRGSGGYGDTLVQGDPIQVDWLSGFCMLMRAETYRSVRGFDEDFFLYFEDVDLCERIRQSGLACVIDRRTQLLHYESTSTSMAGKSALYRAGMWTYFSKHGNPFERAIARTVRGRR
ncbi:glycosyltransferase [Microbacterium sp. SYP-A9085]|uniref:glycosyltransferase family 2 protein n=1 Tax=Microbacterium sp. SYP-A9085 TaxID=2664454 RepID=UPI00129AAD68|nr:glycosyltransferase family 2 protein [Microbacterium sp. SYP-A9085]MRH29153.1 glycosyltransferase [Microbacterium sp. SYP-A9085]